MCFRFCVTAPTPIAFSRRCISVAGWPVSAGLLSGPPAQLLERSIVDRMVGAAERLVFEGGPILVPPLAQDPEIRRPVATEGGALDSLATCSPLTVVEKSRFDELRAKAAYALEGVCAGARARFVDEKADELVKRTGVTLPTARRTIEAQCNGLLLPSIALPFDDPEFAGCTVADILRDPERFVGGTLADPIEGVDYGKCVAKVMQRRDRSVWIHSFAHGRTVYDLRYDAATVRRLVEAASKEDVVETIDLNRWHSMAHRVTGHMALRWCRASAKELRQWSAVFRQIADEMEAQAMAKEVRERVLEPS